MTRSVARGLTATLALVILAGAPLDAFARDRPLTITRKTGVARGNGIQYLDGGRHIIAWGGFSANGYGYGRMGPEAASRAARNDSVRLRTAGIYGYGLDGLGGTGFRDDLRGGYNNPSYGNAYNSYVGYNGVPTNLAFGPGFASRYITDHEDDDDDAAITGPSPAELGYAASPAAFAAPDE